MSNFLKLFDSSGNSVQFIHTEVTDGGAILPHYLVEIGTDKSTTGDIKQQIRPGKRFQKQYILCISEAQYINLVNLLTNGSDDYFAHWETAPSILTNDSQATSTNDFAVAVQFEAPEMTVAESSTLDVVYRLPVTISSVELL